MSGALWFSLAAMDHSREVSLYEPEGFLPH
jgi:hypothetical protein